MGFGSSPFGSAPFGSSASLSGGLGIVDSVFNPLISGSVSMLGFVAPPPEAEALSLRIYEMILEEIRRSDALEGNLFLKRYLQGHQNVWDQIWNKIFELRTLNDVTSIADEFLYYLQDIVGWVGSLKRITDRLDAATLRRLISVSVRFWKLRGTEDTIVDTLRLVTGARVRTWNWFDYRWVLDETGLGHESDGHDPWLISIDNNQEFNVRIVDDGTLDRELVRELVKLMRPLGERVEITYLALMDLFETDADNSQWTSNLIVEDGIGALSDTLNNESAAVIVPGSELWTSYAASFRIRGYAHSVWFHYTDNQNYYRFQFGVANVWVLWKNVNGVETSFGNGSFDPYYPLPNEWYTVRVEIVWTGSENIISIYLDGVLVVAAADADLPAGSVAIAHFFDGTVELDELEVISLPASTDFIDINS